MIAASEMILNDAGRIRNDCTGQKCEGIGVGPRSGERETVHIYAHLQAQDVFAAAALPHAVEEVLKDLGRPRQPLVRHVIQVTRRILLVPPVAVWSLLSAFS